jgi:hypothetical protein
MSERLFTAQMLVTRGNELQLPTWRQLSRVHGYHRAILVQGDRGPAQVFRAGALLALHR